MTVNIRDEGRNILTVSKLNRLARNILTTEIGLIWLSAEISNFVAASSGHWYFTLKDNNAQVRAAMFKGNNRQVRQRPREGDKVLVRASVGLYEPRGDYQLVVEHLQQDGEGQLKLAFDALKQKLYAEGLFDTVHKQPIPKSPPTIGVITSAQGAALHDVLTVLKRRSPTTKVIVYPAMVQGEQAAKQLIKCIKTANARAETGVILLTRGGGSLEDLWCFNDEALARAIVASHIPIVSAVGHEVDFTIADLAADLRAPTPSAGAELLSDNVVQRASDIQQLLGRLQKACNQSLIANEHKLNILSQKLKNQHPSYHLRQQEQHIDSLSQSLQHIMSTILQGGAQKQNRLENALLQQHPKHKVDKLATRHHVLQQQLGAQIKHIVSNKQQQLATLAQLLNSVSPLATMQRGYSIAVQNDKTISSTENVTLNDPMTTRLHDGDIVSVVKSISRNKRD